MKTIDGKSWHGRLFIWSYTAFNRTPPQQFDLWLYVTTVLAVIVFLICGLAFSIVLNIGTLPFGVFVEPIWRADARFRRLTFPGGIPIISVALPFWLALATWHTFVTRGPAEAIGPFFFTPVLAFGLLGLVVVFNRMRRKSSKLTLRDDGPKAD